MPGVSRDEKQYIIRGCNEDIRTDGRNCMDFRTITVDSNIFPQVNGSSRVQIGDTVDILCSIKADVTRPSVGSPNKGLLSVNVDISPVCKIAMGDDSALLDGDAIAEALEKNILSSSAFPADQLAIVPGHHVWTIYVDLLVLQMKEDVTTACSIATYVALNNMIIPKTYPKKNNDFDVDGDVTLASHLQNGLDIPILLSLAKIGQSIVVDTTHSEVECADSMMTVGIDRRGKIQSFHLGGKTAVVRSDMERSFQVAVATADNIFQYLSSYCQAQQLKELENEFPYMSVSSAGLRV